MFKKIEEWAKQRGDEIQRLSEEYELVLSLRDTSETEIKRWKLLADDPAESAEQMRSHTVVLKNRTALLNALNYYLDYLKNRILHLSK